VHCAAIQDGHAASSCRSRSSSAIPPCVVGAISQAERWPSVSRPGRQGGGVGQARRVGAYARRLRAGLQKGRLQTRSTRGDARAPHGQRHQHQNGSGARARSRLPLSYETSTTLPVDFHSGRRAFNTALAEAGVNAQHAMHLAAHADAKVHARYVMSNEAMRTIPHAAVPKLPPIVMSRDDSGSARSRSGKEFVGAIGIEPTTPTVSR